MNNFINNFNFGSNASVHDIYDPIYSSDEESLNKKNNLKILFNGF